MKANPKKDIPIEFRRLIRLFNRQAVSERDELKREVRRLKLRVRELESERK